MTSRRRRRRRSRSCKSRGAVRRSCLCPAAAAGVSAAAAAPRVHRVAAAAPAGRPVHPAHPGLSAGSRLGAAAGLCGASAAEQHHLRQCPQHGGCQSGHQDRQHHHAKWATGSASGRSASQHSRRSAQDGRRHSHRSGRRAGAAAVGSATGVADSRIAGTGGNAGPRTSAGREAHAACSRAAPSIDFARTGRETAGPAIAGRGRTAAAPVGIGGSGPAWPPRPARPARSA